MRCYEPLRTLSRNLLFLLLLGALAIADVKIYLKNSAASFATLRDVATIEGDVKLSNFLGSIAIDQRYLADGVLSKKEVKATLATHYIDPSKIAIYGGPVRLFHKGGKVTKEELKNVVLSYVKSRYPDFVVESVSIPLKEVTVDGGRYRVTLKERSKTFRHLYLTLEIQTHNGVLKSVPVTVKVSQLVRAAFAKRDIPRGKVITPQDVEIRKIKRYNSLQKGVDPAVLYGSVAKRTIHAGQQIRPSAYEPDYAVKKRSSVKILYERGAIRIELLGLALENGQKGDIIKVKNLSSNKVLRCKVLSSGSVLFVQ